MNPYSLQDAAHVVQLALTPVFLLSATATLLGVFSSRLARVADRVHVLAMLSGDDHIAELTLLKRRSRVLDVAVVIAALGGGLTCVAVLILFLSELRETEAARYLFFVVWRSDCSDNGLVGSIRDGDAAYRAGRKAGGRQATRKPVSTGHREIRSRTNQNRRSLSEVIRQWYR